MSTEVPGVRLRRTAESSDAVSALGDLLGGTVGLEAMLGDLNRRARRFRAPGSTVSSSMRWNVHDCLDRRWWPQGVTSSADASVDETYAGRRVLAVSWYAKARRGVRKGSRISVLDIASRAYRHVLLVVPSLDDSGRLRVDPLPVHAGGIVWHGPYLHVAATRRGLFTARLDQLLRVPDRLRTDDRDAIGVDGDRLASFGYRYLLPVCSSYAAEYDDGVEPMRYSFASLARTQQGPRLITGEYGRGAMTRRLVQFRIDGSTSAVTADADGAARPELLHDGGVGNMQGATVVDGRWYVTRSRGPWGRGSICVGEPGALVEHQRALPMGPEDLTYWPSTDLFWTVSEWPGRRWIAAIPRARLG
ncbi:hypothetical protein [Solicola gregarius]|uniref:Uncharacterized protein n=1 Tax=Solicola gregarius TaxID=2908642 RepID=A0AA46YM66_9ACTN|nr:hypothetical protein [Solicola gregarius]UYM06221.1 hypothetical protein L0C25_03850 [Solicola gregarius]